MTRNERTIRALPDQVWDVLSDGWLYPVWVVGATRMRDVDGNWPEVGSCLHHSAGVWPLVVSDSTEVLENRPGSVLRMRARGWPIGEAEACGAAWVQASSNKGRPPADGSTAMASMVNTPQFGRLVPDDRDSATAVPGAGSARPVPRRVSAPGPAAASAWPRCAGPGPRSCC